MDRLKWKNDIIYKLGILFGPIQRINDDPESYNNQEEARILARFCSEYPKLTQEFKQFCTAQPGEDYDIQYTRLWEALTYFKADLAREGRTLSDAISYHFPKARSAVESVPVPVVSAILDASTPFSTYCKVRELCEADTLESLVLIDPFLEASVFHRYLETAAENIFVTLVTSKLRESAGRRDRDRLNAFLDVSRLFAQERGKSSYRLVLHPSGVLHDRWLVLDEKRIYSLGSSVKDAGDKQYYTITGLDASSQNLRKIGDHIESGEEYFGSSTDEHLQIV